VEYRDKPELQERLAAEYVLGTLRGPARARFQGWMQADAALARIVREWEARLSPMAAAIAEVKPPRRVWRAVEARITAGRATAGAITAGVPPTPPSPVAPGPRTPTRREQPSGLWESVAFWRNWGLAATGAVAALAVALVLPPQSTVTSPSARQTIPPSYVAMVHDQSGAMKLAAFAQRDSSELWVKMENMPLQAGKSYELWALPSDGGKPVSLGVLPTTAMGRVRLAAAADRTLSDVPWLAVSLEPEGGSPTGAPTQVVAKGDCVKLW
jgi:anti-sigma-K factor RskA